VVNYIPWLLKARETNLVPTSRLYRPHNQSEHFGKEKNLFPLPGFKPSNLQPNCYTNYAIPALSTYTDKIKLGPALKSLNLVQLPYQVLCEIMLSCKQDITYVHYYALISDSL
jgi:hypothetical protein